MRTHAYVRIARIPTARVLLFLARYLYRGQYRLHE